MILCIDIGNTSIKLARVDDAGRVRDLRMVPTLVAPREIARAVVLTGRGSVARAAIASVRPRSTAGVVAAVRRELDMEAFVVTHRVKLPIKVATRRPARVGIDRLCAASGAVSGNTRSAIIVDVGSAITVDLVLDRRFVGGLIMAGPQMMLTALHRDTAQLPSLRIGDRGVGKFDDTAPAMLTGAVVGSVGSIEAAVRLLRRSAGRRLPVRLTGGHSRVLSSILPSTWVLHPELTLQGIAAITRLNRRGL